MWSNDVYGLGWPGMEVNTFKLLADGSQRSIYYSAQTFQPDMENWIVLDTVNPEIELHVRGQGFASGASRSYLAYYQAGTGQMHLQRADGGGVFVELAPVVLTNLPAGSGLGISAEGNVLTIWTAPVGLAEWNAIMSATDSTFPTGGQLGFVNYFGTRTFGAIGGGSIVAAPPADRTAFAPARLNRQPQNALGCGQYRAQVWNRGGTQLLYDNLAVTNVQWSRVLSDTSDASCNLVGIGLTPDCTSAIRDVWPWEHELALSREPGGLVWMGPVVKSGSKFTTGKFEARDLSAWWDRRNLPISRSYDQIDLSTIFNELALDAQFEDPFGLEVEATPTGVLASRIYRAGNYLLAGAQLRELTKAGVDWTLVGREALVGGIVVPADPIAFLQDSHIRESPQVDRDGLSAFANRAIMSGAGGGEQDNPIVGQAQDDDSITVYGLSVETANVDAIRDAVSATAAAQSRVDLVSTPAVILGDVSLSPTAPVLVSQLVPGAVVSCAFASSGIPVAGLFRLQKVQATGQGDGERIVVSLQPLGAGGDS